MHLLTKRMFSMWTLSISFKDFNIFMFVHTLHCGRKHFSYYCLQAFSSKEILKSHLKDCFIN